MPRNASLHAASSIGYRIDGVQLSQGIDAEAFAEITAALHEHLVVCISGVPFGPEKLIEFAHHFGPLEDTGAKSAFGYPGFPEVMVLSNEVIDGKPQGTPDAGQVWHTDMSYNLIAGYATLLHSHKVPYKAGKALGDTAFRDMYAAYEALPCQLKEDLDAAEAVHDFAKIWTMMIERGAKREPWSANQRRLKPPVIHPVVLRHPWTGRKALYVNRGVTTTILGLPDKESNELLSFLFEHQEKEEFAYRHEWRVGDTLIWDNSATIHLALGGYDATTPRRMIRAQVLGDAKRYRAANGTLGGRQANYELHER